EILETRSIVVDITERKRAEVAFRKYMEELKRSNEELEQFAYIASHDLQEPLRKIQAFGDRVRSKYKDVLDERGQDYLRRMQEAAARMQSLITDLLMLSRVTSKAQPFVEVDLDQVAHEVLSDLEVRIERMGGQVEISDMPTVKADPMQMRQLLQNLISNALKFRREDRPPSVKVYGRVLRGSAARGVKSPAYQIHVEDNGIGFDEKYLDRIFKPFQRLHGRNTYEGSGIGLAICHKIAERHGGAITATSTPGQGATFTITLNKNPGEGGVL
ncbi:MAG: ATP-binding protein, partial [Rhodothermales bacterium]